MLQLWDSWSLIFHLLTYSFIHPSIQAFNNLLSSHHVPSSGNRLMNKVANQQNLLSSGGLKTINTQSYKESFNKVMIRTMKENLRELYLCYNVVRVPPSLNMCPFAYDFASKQRWVCFPVLEFVLALQLSLINRMQKWHRYVTSEPQPQGALQLLRLPSCYSEATMSAPG